MEILDTICAPATIPGTGAITVIRVSGSEALSVCDKVVSFVSGTASSSEAGRVKFGTVADGDEMVDEVLVSIFKAPHSYTGEDSVEISCHASGYICQRILELLCAAGCRLAEPGEFTRRAFVNGKMDLAQAEAVADVISSSNKASLRLAMNQLKGGYSHELSGLREQMLKLTSLLELELDFSEEEVEFADRTQLNELVAIARAKVDALAGSFHLGNAIKNGVPVAIVGAPNTGKSTLLNALLGEERAIVTDIAGTTRDTIEETLTLDGILYRFIDTAGIRETDEVVEKIGIQRSLDAISKADIVLAVIDLTTANIESEISEMLARVDTERQKLIILLNKTDVADTASFMLGSDMFDAASVLKISAATGFGLDALRAKLRAFVPSGLSSSESMVTNMRHYEALRQTSISLSRVADALATGIPSDLVAVDLNDALYHLGTITGEISNDEVLGNIFAHFCIGK